LGKKVIYDVHEDYPETIPMKEIFPKFIRKFSGLTIKIIEQIFARFSNAVIVVTPSIYERFIKYTKNTYAVHNYPIIKPHKFIPWNERKDDVFYIGSIAQNRGIYEMIKAIGLVQKKYSVKLVLAGSFTSDFLEREIKAQPEFVFVDYKGFIDPVEAELIKERVKIGLIVLHPEPRYQVSLPVKFFEYMAAGIPVIASDFPLWRKIVEEANCGLLVNPKKPENIADAIVSILKNPEKSETMGKCAYDWVRKNYSWENEQKTLLDLYNTLVSKTSKHS
ncbi:MAG: glycosyltransferase, partial [Candidatus Latescibacteria bacterium]|nr:glycosyltransferase [Candidatus Latescibacterota bacterium]